MTLLMMDLNLLPFGVVTGAVAFVSSYAVTKTQIKTLKKDFAEFKKKAESNDLALRIMVATNDKEVEDKFTKSDEKRETLKDDLNKINVKVEKMGVQVNEIHRQIVK